jgi:hypothetical protein
MEAILPALVADDRDRMSIASDILGRLETTAQDRRDAEGVEIVRRDDAARRARERVRACQSGLMFTF